MAAGGDTQTFSQRRAIKRRVQRWRQDCQRKTNAVSEPACAPAADTFVKAGERLSNWIKATMDNGVNIAICLAGACALLWLRSNGYLP
jgi:hypothetical protein